MDNINAANRLHANNFRLLSSLFESEDHEPDPSDLRKEQVEFNLTER